MMKCPCTKNPCRDLFCLFDWSIRIFLYFLARCGIRVLKPIHFQKGSQ